MADKPYIDLANFVEPNKYRKLTNITIYIPVTGLILPKDGDYDKGYFYRYFYQQSNNKEGRVKEIVEKEYNKLDNNFLYKILKIKWKIIGNAQKTTNINNNVVEVANKILPGISDVLSRDLLQFWRDIPDVIVKFDVTDQQVGI